LLIKNNVYICTPFLKLIEFLDMLIIPVKEGENIERALKRYKKKFEKTNVMRQLRDRQQFTKPSVENRQEKIRAAYKQRLRSEEI